MRHEALIAIGRLTKPHGVHGELVLLPYVADFGLLPELATLSLHLQRGTEPVQEHTVVAWRIAHKKVLIRLQDCTDLPQAEAFREYEVLIPRQCFPTLPAGEYYWFELEGLAVYASDGRSLGTLAEIIYTRSNDVFVVRNGSRETLVPALKSVVRAIDVERGEMHLFAVPGLLE
jgi:16S rRNA processing protein RimM